MDFDRWLSFAVASLALGALPGPSVANVVGHAVRYGRRVAFAAVTGAVAGSIVSMAVSLTGAATVLKASPVAYRLLGFVGGAYLVVLGLLSLRAPGKPPSPDGAPGSRETLRSAFVAGLAVSAANPKTILFFVAFVPRFIDPVRGFGIQAAILVATFAAAIALTDSVYVLMAGTMIDRVRSRAVVTFARAGSGILLIGLGIAAIALS